MAKFIKDDDIFTYLNRKTLTRMGRPAILLKEYFFDESAHSHDNKAILDTISTKITASPTEPENPSEGDVWIPI